MSDADADGFLGSPPTDPAEIRAYYDDWASRYDADLAGWGYRAPSRVSAMLAAAVEPDADVLDAGCGTGMAGRALRTAGFTGRIVGVDVSEASLAVARGCGAYDEVRAASLDDPLPFADGEFGAVVCVGVLTYVADTEACWREFCRVVASGGAVAFTQRDDVWRERSCEAAAARLEASGAWTMVEVSDPDAYVPGSAELAEVPARYVLARVR